MILISFLLITISIMTVSILIIYRVFKFVGLNLRLEALVLCGVLAFVVNFTAISVSEYLTARHFMLLGGMIVVSAFIVTFYNSWLLKRRQTGAALETVPAVPETVPAMPAAPEPETEVPEAEEPKTEFAADIIERPEPKPVAMEDPAPVIPEEIPSEIIEDTEPESDESISITEDEINELGVEPEDSGPAIPSPEERYRRMVEEVSALETMDDILDYAYRQKSNDNSANAIYAYKHALEKFHDDSYAPFVVIELCNIYKANGFYSGAIEAYTEALDYPALKEDPAMQQTFRQSINYLKITEYLLAEAKTPGLPFSKIPDSLRQTIEQVYKLSKTR